MSMSTRVPSQNAAKEDIIQSQELAEVGQALNTAGTSLKVATEMLYELSRNAAATNEYSGPVIAKTVNLALTYRDEILPYSIEMVTNLQSSLEDYIDLTIEIFVRNINDILEDTQGHKEKAFQLKVVHQQVAADLKVTASEAEDAVTIAKSAGDSARSIFSNTTEIVKGLDGLNVVSGAVVAAGVALSSVATGGAALAVWGPLLVAGGTVGLVGAQIGKDQQSKKADRALAVVEHTGYAADVLSTSLQSCIQSFICAMNTIAGFFAALEAELTIHAERIEKVKDRHEQGLAARKLERHFALVQAKAKDLRQACRAYVLRASEVKVNLMALEIRRDGYHTAGGPQSKQVIATGRFQEVQ